MRLGSRTRLGLALSEQRLLLAEVRLNGRAKVIAVDAIDLTPELADDAAALGKALRQRLKECNVRSRHAVVGLPAKWLAARSRPVPPADADAVRQMLRLTADRAFTVDADELVIDYVPPAAGSAEPVLLVAALRKHVKFAKDLAAAAGLSVDAVVSTAAAMPALTDPVDAACVLRMDDTAAEIAVMRDGRLAGVHHLSRTDNLDELAGALKRRLATEPALAQTLRTTSVGVSSWNNHFATVRAALAGVCEGGIEPLSMTRVNGDVGETDRQMYAPAIAAAMHEAGADMAVDFLHSRLAEAVKASVLVRWRGAIGAAAVVLLAVLIFAWSAYAQQSELNDLKQQLAATKDDAAAARDLIGKVRRAEGWFADRPRAMEMLRDLTMAFPDRGAIWLTELSVREDNTGLLSGRSEEDRTVLDLRDRLAKAPGVSQVKLLYMREAGRTKKEISFSLSMKLAGATWPIADKTEPPTKPADKTAEPATKPAPEPVAVRDEGEAQP